MNRTTNTRYTGRPYYTPETSAFEKFLGRIQLYLAPLVLSIEVFLHSHGFGREYITRVRIAVALALLLVVHLLWCYGIQFDVWKWHIVILPRHGRSEWFIWYTSLFIALAFWKRITCVREVSGLFFDRGMYRSCWTWLGLSEHWIYCWIEPIFALSVAAWLPQPLKGWLIAAGVAMFVKYHIEELEHSLAEKKYVITRTGVDEINQIASATRQKRAQSTHHARTGAGRDGYPTEKMAYDNLDPKYQAMMNRRDKS